MKAGFIRAFSTRAAARTTWLVGLIGCAALACAVFYFLRAPAPEPVLPAGAATNVASRPSPVPGFVGAQACAACHPAQYAQWQKSTHGQAGGLIDEAKLLARFDGQPLRFADATVIPTTNAAGRPVFLLDQPGASRLEIQVDAAVGGGHLLGGGTQTFFNEFPDGTMRFLPFDFIRDENVWFVQLRRDNTWAPVSPEISLQRDLANWPPHRVLGTLVDFSNCQNCHGSQITLRYDPARLRYETRFTSLTINCESCHGPGERHMEIMSRPDHGSAVDIGMSPLAALDKDQSVKVCLQCHANKVSIRDEPYLPGADLDSYFSIKLSHFWHSPWLPDGRVRGFGYQGNHLYSDCYLNGSMSCVDCHDPHSQEYRDLAGKPLTGRFDNGQCTGCHASKGINSSLHSHHAPGSEGDRCTSCHMPFLQHQGVGRLLRFARSDHTIPIPRPGFDEQLGIENACQKCHADRGLDWQLAKVREWYGEIKPHSPIVADLLEAGAPTDPAGAAELLLAPQAGHPMAQAAGLSHFIQRYLSPGMNPMAGTTQLLAFARSADLDLRALALVALHIATDDPTAKAAVSQAKAQLGGDEDPLRNRWTVTADQWGTMLAQRQDMAGAIRCFQAALEIQPRNVVSLSNLALAYLHADQPERCLSTLRQAIAIKPSQAALHFHLGRALAQLERWSQARDAFKEGLKYAPGDATARRMLELLPE